MYLILPKTLPALEEYQRLPLFFLAGPVNGGGDWHVPMSNMLMKRFEHLLVVNPSRYENPHPFCEYRMKGAENQFTRQTDWERHFLDQAEEKWPSGCIIFWLACENKNNPRQDGQPYARDTRGEIGEWRGRMMHNPHLRIVMGADSDFPGLSQIKRNFELALPSFKIYETMEEVVEQAVLIAHP